MSHKNAEFIEQLRKSPITEAMLQQIIKALVEADVAVMDAAEEKAHWIRAFGKVQLELKAILAVVMARYKLTHFDLTASEVARIPSNVDLHVGDPEPKVRRYEFKPKSEGKPTRRPIETEVDRAMRRH